MLQIDVAVGLLGLASGLVVVCISFDGEWLTVEPNALIHAFPLVEGPLLKATDTYIHIYCQSTSAYRPRDNVGFNPRGKMHHSSGSTVPGPHDCYPT